MKVWRFVLFFLALYRAVVSAQGGVVIGEESLVPPDPRQDYSRFVRFRPADGQVVTLNPPRFSWPFAPGIAATQYDADTLFTLQISKNKSFSKPEVEIKDTDCNFYNFLPGLKGARQVLASRVLEGL